jgi:hypothetical protein
MQFHLNGFRTGDPAIGEAAHAGQARVAGVAELLRGS